MLNIVASYHRMKFHEKPMIQTLDMPQKTHFGSDLGPSGTNLCHQFFFSFKLGLVSPINITITEKTNDPILTLF